jgi:hypothetical protein
VEEAQPLGIAMTEEKLTQLLIESAKEQFGEERVRILNPAIREIARSIALLREQAIDRNEEPAFFS